MTSSGLFYTESGGITCAAGGGPSLAEGCGNPRLFIEIITLLFTVPWVCIDTQPNMVGFPVAVSRKPYLDERGAFQSFK